MRRQGPGIGQMLLTARSFTEYQAMFALSEGDLRGRVLDCPGGAASFVAEAGARGLDAVAADPVYAGSRATLGDRALGEIERGLAFVEAHVRRFVWSWYGDAGEFRRLRTAAARRFAADLAARPQRYLPAALPALPFPDGTFDLVLSSHLLAPARRRGLELAHVQTLYAAFGVAIIFAQHTLVLFSSLPTSGLGTAQRSIMTIMGAQNKARNSWIDCLLSGSITLIFILAGGLVGLGTKFTLGDIIMAAIVGGLFSAPLPALVRMVGPSSTESGSADRFAELRRARALREARGRWPGAIWIAASFLILLAGFTLIVVTQANGLGPVLISPLLLPVSALLFMRGRRIRAKGAERILEGDPRPPIIYLRPFEVDCANRRAISADSFLGETAEQKMAKDLRDIAPFVALGNPVDDLPELGAARLYAENAEWQEKIKDLTKRAGTIILHAAGNSDGLAWEVQYVVSLGQPERIVFLEGYNANDYNLFYHAFAHLFPCGLLKNATSPYQYFDAGWTPHSFDEHSRIYITGPLNRQRDQVLHQLFKGRH